MISPVVSPFLPQIFYLSRQQEGQTIYSTWSRPFFLLSLAINEQDKHRHWEMVQLRGGISELQAVYGFKVKTGPSHRKKSQIFITGSSGTVPFYFLCPKGSTIARKSVSRSCWPAWASYQLVDTTFSFTYCIWLSHVGCMRAHTVVLR